MERTAIRGREKHGVPKKKSKLGRTFQKVISLRSATTKIASSNSGICNLNPCKPDHRSGESDSRAVMEAVLAKLFASVTSIKASYAELQTAQDPYNGDLIQTADQSVVEELRSISELKRSFLRKDLADLSPQITTMLAEVQEQQGLMKTYEITIKKLGAESEKKDSDLSSLRRRLAEAVAANRAAEKQLAAASGSQSAIFDAVKLSSLKPSHFAAFLHGVLRSARSFVKILVGDMESARWDLDTAARFIEPGAFFRRQSHRWFAFESFICKTMLEGFNSPTFDLVAVNGDENTPQSPAIYLEKFKNVRVEPGISQNPESEVSKFVRAKYLQVVHAKMECSVFGSLSQRKAVASSSSSSSSRFPETPFFEAFAEMARRVWLLHKLAFAFGDEVTVFQVRKGSRFSEVYMESRLSRDALIVPPSPSSSSGEASSELRVGFTVVPGFKIGKTVFQSQVYLSPVTATT